MMMLQDFTGAKPGGGRACRPGLIALVGLLLYVFLLVDLLSKKKEKRQSPFEAYTHAHMHTAYTPLDLATARTAWAATVDDRCLGRLPDYRAHTLSASYLDSGTH